MDTHLGVKTEHAVRAREHRYQHNQAASWSGCWFQILYRRICGRQGGEMDGRDQKGSLYCPDTTSRRLQCLHSRSLESLSRTIPDIAELLNPLEDQHLILALTGRQPCSREERDLLALPVRLGGMGITNPVSTSHRNFEASTRLTSPLAATKIRTD